MEAVGAPTGIPELFTQTGVGPPDRNAVGGCCVWDGRRWAGMSPVGVTGARVPRCGAAEPPLKLLVSGSQPRLPATLSGSAPHVSPVAAT